MKGWYSFHVGRNPKTGEQHLLLFDEKARAGTDPNDRKFSLLKRRPLGDDCLTALVTVAWIEDEEELAGLCEHMSHVWGCRFAGNRARNDR